MRELILNELSVKKAYSIRSARELMARLIDTILAGVQLGAGRSLRTCEPIDTVLLAENYPVARWRNDTGVEREQRSFFRSLTSKSPLLSLGDSEDDLERSARTEILFGLQSALGLGAALILDALPVSLASDPSWMVDHLSAVCRVIDEDGEISEENVELFHASVREHVLKHADWLAEQYLEFSSLSDVWVRRSQLFPALDFCESVGDQLLAIDDGHPLSRQVYKRLAQLDNYFRTWDGRFDASSIPMRITPESDSTLTRFEAEHSFVCPDGVLRLFSWHGRLTPGAWRIYFLPIPEFRKAIIGHIGKKLPGVSYTT